MALRKRKDGEGELFESHRSSMYVAPPTTTGTPMTTPFAHVGDPYQSRRFPARDVEAKPSLSNQLPERGVVQIRYGIITTTEQRAS